MKLFIAYYVLLATANADILTRGQLTRKKGGMGPSKRHVRHKMKGLALPGLFQRPTDVTQIPPAFPVPRPGVNRFPTTVPLPDLTLFPAAIPVTRPDRPDRPNLSFLDVFKRPPVTRPNIQRPLPRQVASPGVLSVPGIVPAPGIALAQVITCIASTAKSSATYNHLVLEGVTDDQVTFEVSGISRITSFDLMLASSDVGNTIETISTLPSREVAVVSSRGYNYGNSLVVPLSSVSNCVETPHVRVTVPRTTTAICTDSGCRPVMCSLSIISDVSDLSTTVSFAVSNNKMLFGERRNCTIVKPVGWDAWALTYFAAEITAGVALQDLYFHDPDGDGLTNIVEFYGSNLRSIFGKNSTPMLFVSGAGYDPLNPDTDGDLLNDGFEWMYGLDPLTENDITLDSDGDGLTTFQEQVFGTSPLEADTDIDEINDIIEIENGSDPLNDKSKASSNVATMNVTLTIGDHGLSYSERYTMVVGPVEHQAPNLGELETATYTLPRGVHSVSVNHRDSILDTPDYDYTALIVPGPSEILEAIIADPGVLLGKHSGSNSDFSQGKSATLTIREIGNTCTLSAPACFCSEDCTSCNARSDCEWSANIGSCLEYTGLSGLFKDDAYDCSCKQCQDWSDGETDTSFIDLLPKCPCTVTYSLFSVVVKSTADVDVTIWSTDLACSPSRPRGCVYFQPGARGCIRANGPSSTGQQCCYDSSGNILAHGTEGAGTPDLVRGGESGHDARDVEPYKNCCKRCKDQDSCSLYIGTPDGARGARGDNRGCVN